MQSTKQGMILEYQTDAVSFRNKIINGNFDIWQRGTSFTPYCYTSDRWVAYQGGESGAASISKVVITPGSIAASVTGCCNCLSFNQTTAASSYRPYLVQKIENVRLLLGKTVTLSYYAWTASGTADITIQIGNNYGTGGSPGENSADVSHVITTTPTRYSCTCTLPSGSGKTIVDSDSYTYVYFNPPMGSTYTIYFTGVQLEEGPIASDFECRPYGMELQLCQRYYEQSTLISSLSGSPTVTGAVFTVAPNTSEIPGFHFRTTKRTDTPTVRVYSRTGVENYATFTDNYTEIAVTPASPHKDGLTNLTASITKGNGYRYHWTADAEL